MRKTKMEKGITLIALIITIVVLLILAVVAINSITNDGLLGKAENAANKYNQAQTDEEGVLKNYGDIIDNILGLEKTITKTGNEDTPVFLNEKGIKNVSLDYSDDQEIRILGTNRFNLANAKFNMSSYNSKCQITKQNNGIKIVTEGFDKILDSLFAYTEFNAEFTGKMWISCDALSEGDVKNIGMQINVNNTSQQLCRGECKLAESIYVNAGDTVQIKLYTHIGSDTANTVEYRNIMVQYETLTDFVEYKEDITSKTNTYNTITLNGNESYTTNTTNAGGSNYRFTCELDFPGILDGILPTSNNNNANVEVSGIDLVSYNATHNNTIGLGISSNGLISIYLGEGYTRAKVAEYLQSNPITITYKTSNKENVNIDNKIQEISEGNIIISNSSFSVTYDYFLDKKDINIVCFGDSITGMYSNETDYPSIITRQSSIQAHNVGFSGCGWTDHLNSNYMPFSMTRLVDSVCSGDFSMQETTAATCGTKYAERLNTLKSIDFAKIDYVTIFYGTNDWGNDVILKSADDTNTSEKYRTNVEDAIKYSVSKLQESYPNLKIIVITPYWRYFKNNDSDLVPNNNGDYLRDYSKYIENVSKNDCNLKTINLYDKLDITISNYINFLSDGTHPNETLKYIISDIIINNM